MKIDFLHTKIFTVLLSIFYVSGLFSVFYTCEILISFLILISLIIFVVFYNLGFKKSLILYLIFFLGVFMAHRADKSDNFMDEIHSNDSKIIGRIVSSKNISNKTNKVKFYVLAGTIEAYNKEFKDLNSKVLVSLEIEDDILNKIEIGDIVEIKGKMRSPSPATNPYQFDYKKYLSYNDCKFILYGDNSSYKKLSEPKFSRDIDEDWFFILKKFEATRNKILLQHAKNIKSPRLEILGGIVFGNETINPDEEIKESFRNSGLLHLLAASGLNVALIYGIWWWIANLIKFPYHLSILLGAIFVIFYTFMTGFPPSILRASLMLLFVLFGKLIDRQADSIALIFFVAFLILLVNPKMLFDVGFQLSFAVTFGLISGCPAVISKFKRSDEKFKLKYKKLSRAKKYFLFLFSPSSIASIVAVPLIAQLWVIPLQMHYFNNFAPFSLLANIAVVPFIGILSFIGFVSSIVALIPYLNEPVVYLFDSIANPLLALLIKISNFFSSFKSSLIATFGLNVYQIFAFWGLILLFILNLKNDFKNKKQFITFLVCLVLFLFSFIKFDYFKGELKIIMFDVGNADSFLIKTPKNKFFLIDTGKKTFRGTSSAQTIINKYLMNERIPELEGLIVTHFDLDHAGGVVDILENNKVKNTFIQTLNPKTKTAEGILEYLKENNLNYKVTEDNETIYTEKDLKITLFKPVVKDEADPDKFENETSIITLLTYKDKNFLFMGDAGVKAFESIKNKMPDKVDILKVGHHGAKHVVNHDMLKKIKPDYALISTGVNQFNHPHFSTITLLDEYRIKMLSSREYGFIEADYKKDFKFYHYDTKSKKFLKVLFDKEIPVPFDKSNYVQELIKKNL